VIATKVGYDFGASRRGARTETGAEIPQDFSPEAVLRADGCSPHAPETDRIDLLQLHNIRMEAGLDDALWTTLEKLKIEGKVRYYGVRRLGPAIGLAVPREQIVFANETSQVCNTSTTCSSNHPGHAIHDAATDAGKDTMFLIRVTHSSGCSRENTLRDNLPRPTIAAIGRAAGC